MQKQLVRPSRVLRDYLSNSLVWEDFLAQGGFVDGDIVVVTPFKAGTTWTQRVVQQILQNGEENDGGLSDASPWLDSSWGDHAQMLATLQKQRDAGIRRVMKSHVPADALPLASEARYVFVGRNGKDLGISFHIYLKNFTAETMSAINRIHAEWCSDHVPLVIPDDVQVFFDQWIDTDGYGCCDLFDMMKSWWKFRDEPNVFLINYQTLRDNFQSEAARLAEFLSCDPASLRMDVIEEHCSFEYMSARAEKMAPFGGGHMGNAKSFFDGVGVDSDYHSVLTPASIEHYDRLAVEKLGKQCAHWLETGEVTSAP